MNEKALKVVEEARIFLNHVVEQYPHTNQKMAHIDKESQLEDAYEEAYREAYKKGYEEGYKEGQREAGIFVNIYSSYNLMTKLNLSLSEAMDLLGTPEVFRPIIHEKMGM